MDSILRDLRYVARALSRTPGFFAITAATLALGIGATTAIFSVINGVLLQSLPYPDADRIVQLWQVNRDGNHSQFSDPNFDDLRTQSRSFAALAELNGPGIVSVSGVNEPVRARAAAVSRQFFDVLGVRPAVGRLFVAEEQRPGGAPAVLVSNRFWRRQLGSAPSLDGRTLTFDAHVFNIVGVMPASLDFPAGNDLWLARELNERNPYRTGHNWQVVGRLRAGVTLEQARAEVTGLTKQLRRQYGDDTWMVDAQITPLREQLVGKVRPTLVLLLGASAVLLLIACANVVNLLVARMAARQGELALRLALGAGRRRLAQQFLTESLILSIVGGAAGLVIAALGIRALLALGPSDMPRLAEIQLNAPVLVFALAISVLTAVALGLLTAWRATRGDVREALAQSQRSQAGGASHRIRGALVVAQMAMTLVLLVGAGLLGRSFLRLIDLDPGFRTRQTVVLDLSIPTRGDSASSRQLVRFYDELIARLRAVAGVAEVGGVNAFPLTDGQSSNGTFLILSRLDEPLDMKAIPVLAKDPTRSGDAEFRVASDGYFRAMRIPLVRGRQFDARDDADAPHVAVISSSLAKGKWQSDENALGKIIQFGNMDGDLRPFTVVGVVGDVHELSLASDPRPTFYATYRQRPRGARSFNFVMQGAAAPAAMISAARAAVHDLRPDVPPRVRTIESVVSSSLADRRFMLLLVGAFGVAALLLATLGVYSVISFLVTQRRQEIGIRVALGAQTRDVMGLVLRQGAGLALAGIAVGAVAALALTRLLSGFLYGVSATDPVAFGGVVLLLTAVALVATFIPARRATAVDPMETLRGG
ncbi:MAG: ABC transporter permease [Gemmatimonadaceae bacterium]